MRRDGDLAEQLLLLEGTLSDPAPRTRNLVTAIGLFREYHLKYPSPGYRWLNAKIKLDTGTVMSNAYAHKCCKIAGIKSKAKHYRYKKPGDPFRVFPNLLAAGLAIDGLLQLLVPILVHLIPPFCRENGLCFPDALPRCPGKS